jgi:PASTA domain
MSWRRTPGRLLIGIVALACALPAAASGKSVTIGSSLERAHSASAICTTAGCVGVQKALSPARATIPPASPVNGVIRSWSVRSTSDGAAYSLRVLRPTGGDSYTAMGSAAGTSAVPTGPEVRLDFPASLRIGQGDRIGLMLGNNSAGLPMNFGGPSDEVNWISSLADGSNGSFFTSAPYELLIQATIFYCEVPDVRGLRTAAAKQVLAAADCAATIVKKPKRKKRKRGRVLKQRTPPGTAVEPGTAITLVVGKKPKRKR